MKKDTFSTELLLKSRAARIVAELWKRASEDQKLQFCQLLAVRAESSGLRLPDVGESRKSRRK